MERRIGDQLVVAFPLEPGGAQHFAGRRHIGRDDLDSCGKAVPGGVFGGKRAQSSTDLHGGDVDAGDTRHQTEPGDANAGAESSTRSPDLAGTAAARKTASLPARWPARG